MTGKPDRVPQQSGITRMDKYEGQWVFIPVGNGKTRVEFYSIAFSRPIVPRFIQDPVVQGILIDSINKLVQATFLSLRKTAEICFSQTLAGNTVIVPGFANKLNRFLIKLIPEQMRLNIFSKNLQRE
jgi:hypothetical protein